MFCPVLDFPKVSFDLNQFVLDGSFSLVLRLDVWVSKTFGSNHFYNNLELV
jgi:hypothetical protein